MASEEKKLRRIPSLEKLIGRTADGTTFVLPSLRSPFEYHAIGNWTWFDWLKYLSILNLLLLCTSLPRWFFIALFLFWRAAYNVGLGYLLHVQSNGQALTKAFARLETTHPRAHDLLRRFLVNDMCDDYAFDQVPREFNAWLLFRRLVDIVLANDLVCYFVFALRFYEPPATLRSASFWAAHTAGALLFLAAAWGKVDAFRVVGDFAWYWGDFFFLVDQKLVFNRVFAIAPHPMYTLGYVFMYGTALMTRSYAVFAVSLFAHVLQLLFLEIVENPHIEKTYGGMVEQDDATQRARQEILYGKGYFRKDLIVLKNFNPFRSADLFMVVIALNSLLLNFLPLPEWYYVAVAVAWRVTHSAGLGYVLYRQSTESWWMANATRHNMTRQEAFDSWKRIYNFTGVMTQVSFFCLFVRYFAHDYESLVDMSRLYHMSIGGVLVYLNIWSSMSQFEVLGEFGWFFGDFFISEAPAALAYHGVYRYFNNPDIVLGFAAHYGMALVASSWEVFGVALFGQALAYLFVRYVETPHMLRKYGHKQVRSKSGVEVAVKEIVEESMDELFDAHPTLKRRVDEVKQVVAKYIDRELSSPSPTENVPDIGGGDSKKEK